jgi:hypothetical protein
MSGISRIHIFRVDQHRDIIRFFRWHLFSFIPVAVYLPLVPGSLPEARDIPLPVLYDLGKSESKPMQNDFPASCILKPGLRFLSIAEVSFHRYFHR